MNTIIITWLKMATISLTSPESHSSPTELAELPTVSSNMSPPATRRIKIWSYFIVSCTDECKASCITCQALVSRGGKKQKSYNTSNLHKHLMTNHPALHKELHEREVARNEESAAELNRLKQPTLVQVIEAKTPYEFDHPRSRKIHETVGEMIAVDCELFNIVKRTGFKRLMNVLEPRYTLPSDKYFSDTLLPEMYTKVKEKITALLSPLKHVSVTTDLWSSIAQDSYLSITLHFIGADYQYQQACLHALPFNDRHTGSEISSIITNCLQAWNVFDKLHVIVRDTNCLQAWNVFDKLHVIVRDNGSNFVAGLRDAGLPNIPFLAHTLQLVIKDGCLAQTCVTNLTGRARKLVSHYKHSNLALKHWSGFRNSLDVLHTD